MSGKGDVRRPESPDKEPAMPEGYIYMGHVMKVAVDLEREYIEKATGLSPIDDFIVECDRGRK